MKELGKNIHNGTHKRYMIHAFIRFFSHCRKTTAHLPKSVDLYYL